MCPGIIINDTRMMDMYLFNWGTDNMIIKRIINEMHINIILDHRTVENISDTTSLLLRFLATSLVAVKLNPQSVMVIIQVIIAVAKEIIPYPDVPIVRAR